MLYYHHSADLWPLHHKVTFDGITKQITINDGENVIDVKKNLYSDWKEWMMLRDYAKFVPAFRSIGGDPINITEGIYAGDIYFLINDWKIVIPHAVQIKGTLYNEDGSTPYIIERGAGVSATVSNLVQTVSTNVNVVTGDLSTVPAAVRANLAPELTHVMALNNAIVPTAADNATAVWEKVLDGLTAEQIMKVALAALAGKRVGIGSATEQYMAHDGTTPAITFAPTDSNGNGIPVVTP